MNISIDPDNLLFQGPGGSLKIRGEDQVARRFAMLIAGECGDSGAAEVARRFGYSRARYYQLRSAFEQQGTLGLVPETRGPKRAYRRTEAIVRLVIRHRFLDPDASPAVVAQKLRQQGHCISKRSVERIFADYGLQKKTLRA